MAEYTITEVMIEGVPVRVGDRIELFTVDLNTHAGVVEFFDDRDAGFGVMLIDYADTIAYSIHEILFVTPLPPVTDDDQDERHAVETEHFPTAWDRVLGVEEAP